MPTYRIDNTEAPEGTKPRVVEGPLPGSARAHVAFKVLKVTRITASEAMRLGRDGIELEIAGEVAPDASVLLDAGQEQLELGGEGEADEQQEGQA